MTQSAVAFKDGLASGRERKTDGLWTHLGKLVLPVGSLDGAALVPGTVQQLIGSYAQALSYTLPASSVWTETPIQVTVTFSGVLVRCEFAFLVACPTKGQRIFWGIMVDGAVPSINLGAMDAPENNYGTMAVGQYYFTPSATSHRFSVGLYGPSGSQIYSAIASTLYLTEQKR